MLFSFLAQYTMVFLIAEQKTMLEDDFWQRVLAPG